MVLVVSIRKINNRTVLEAAKNEGQSQQGNENWQTSLYHVDLVSELCPFDCFFFQTFLYTPHLSKHLDTFMNFIGICIRSRRCVTHKNDCFRFL